MKLVDLRKLSIRQQVRIHFAIRNGMECVVNEAGIAKVPALHAIPDFNLEQELAVASAFLLEPVEATAKPRQIGRDELASMAAASAGGAAPEHEEE